MSLTLTETILLVPFTMMMGSVITAFFMDMSTNPTFQAFVNATSLVLKNTEVVWRPALNFAVMVLGPFKGVALTAAKFMIKTLILTVIGIINLVKVSVNVTSSILVATKDFAVSFGTVVKGFTNLFANMVHAFSFVIKSFEDVNAFLYRAFFEAHTISWNDIYNISVPFVVVLSIVGYLTYRANRILRPAESIEVKETPFIPRRSSRIAQKRAMLLCNDLDSLAPASKKTSTTATNL